MLAKFVLAKFVLEKYVLAKFVLVKFVLAKFVLTKHIAMSKLFIITFSVMIIFSENIIQHISADVTVPTFHEELFGSGNFKISDLVMNSTIILFTKAELLQEGIFFLIHLFVRVVLVMKTLKIEKTKPTLTISVLKVEY